ncbi:MAG TPA: ornithine cyclodeaminase family protein [Rhizomicrobium sp.]|nr:ornithine cyclodeaminase family protein [Rhizomicrobium sp.]
MALWLTESDVRALLSLPELIEATERALAAFSAHQIDQPVRTAIEIRDRTFFASMPALDGGHGILGAKLVTVYPDNAARGLHTHLAVISLFDADTGELAAIMDGRYITELRTAAASAVSVRHLARRDASTLAILGSGVQARSHLAALPLVRNFREIRAWSPTPARLAEFARGPVQPAPTAEAAVRGADVILLATSSIKPAIVSEWVDAGAHVIAIGACRPSQREIDPQLVARAALFTDSRAAILKESGDVIQSIREGLFAEDHVLAELGEVVNGSKPGRTSDRQITLFKSLGLAIEDLTAADLVYRRARESGRGLEVSL